MRLTRSQYEEALRLRDEAHAANRPYTRLIGVARGNELVVSTVSGVTHDEAEWDVDGRCVGLALRSVRVFDLIGQMGAVA